MLLLYGLPALVSLAMLGYLLLKWGLGGTDSLGKFLLLVILAVCPGVNWLLMLALIFSDIWK